VRKVSDRTITYLAMTGLIVTLCAQTVRSPAEELVKFDSVPYLRGQIQQRQARERGETPANAPDATIDGYLSKPDGSGPFPAVVYVHGCSGLSTNTRKCMAERLTASV
jgi:hypothetical protein